MRFVVINIEFQDGKDTFYVMHPDGTFSFNAFATLLENNPITNVSVFMKDKEDIEKANRKENNDSPNP